MIGVSNPVLEIRYCGFVEITRKLGSNVTDRVTHTAAEQ